LKLDGTIIPTSRPEESDVFASLIRQYKIGKEATLSIRRGAENLDLKVTLDASPEGTSELDSFDCETLEFNSRDIGQADRVSDKLPDDFKGVLITAVTPAGWAALGGLSAGDMIISIDGKPVESIEALKPILVDLEKNLRSPIVLFVRRGITTRYIELEPSW
jgi:serine protease Do